MKLSCYNRNSNLAVPYLGGWNIGDVLLCCPGPSLAYLPKDIHRPGLTVAAINTAYPKVRPDIWFGMDIPECYNSSLVKESFIKIFRDCYSGVDFNGGPLYDHFNTYFATVEEHPGDLVGMIDFDFPFVPWYKNTLAVSLYLLMWMGAKNIYLVGCDLGGDKDYWDDRKLSDQEREKNRLLYSQQLNFLTALRPLAESIGVNIISATSSSPINTYLQNVDIEDLILKYPDPGQEKPEHVMRIRASKLDELTEKLYWSEEAKTMMAEGVLIMADKDQEWMLEWWYENFRRHCNLPVHFVDIGMSPSALSFCYRNGTVTHIPNIPLKNWFKKPYALMQTPFMKTIYMALDCQVMGDISEMMTYESFAGVSDIKTDFSIGNDPINTGVIRYDFMDPLVTEWARSVNYNAQFHRSDQEILQAMIHNSTVQWNKMPLWFNWVRLRGENNNAIILHWTGPVGKEIIKEQIKVEV